MKFFLGIESELEQVVSPKLLNEIQRTFVAIKPDGVKRKLIGEIIGRLEEKGLQLVGIKTLRPHRPLVEEHYAEHKGKGFFDEIVSFISAGQVIAMVWEGKSAISHVRRLIGATNPLDALPGTIRGDLCLEAGENVIHASDSADNAEREIKLWFHSYELISL